MQPQPGQVSCSVIQPGGAEVGENPGGLAPESSALTTALTKKH